MSVEKLGEFIKDKRLEKRLTREKFASILNISHSHLNSIERGLRTPSRDLLRSIAKELGVDTNQLFNILESNGEERVTTPSPTKPKSRIPDLPPDEPPLTPEEEKFLQEPYRVYFSMPYLSRLSNAQQRQIANLIRDMVEEGDEED